MATILYSDYAALTSLLETQNPGILFVLCDSNTRKHCFPLLEAHCRLPENVRFLEVPAGEQFKNIETCTQLWQQLSDAGADRNSLLLNLGGGVITDMGGFVAATFQRGMPFIQIPTSLLAMADAAIGGKNGVDMGRLKNQIGLFSEARALFIDPGFLVTLPPRHVMAGYAEMMKISLVLDSAFWSALQSASLQNIPEQNTLINRAIQLKLNLIEQDPFDQGIRKLLNFGHTIGHAIESYALGNTISLLHGEAVALGMIAELRISEQCSGLDPVKSREIIQNLRDLYPIPEALLNADRMEILRLMKFDKKNRNGKINFTLISSIGAGKIDQYCPDSMILEALDFLFSRK